MTNLTNENEINQSFSLLLDEVLGKEESLQLLQRIEEEPSLKKAWNRYLLASEVMRSHRFSSTCFPDPHFVDRVSAKVAEEPTVLVPQRRRYFTEKYMSGALAASIMLIAVLVAYSLGQYSPMKENLFITWVERVHSPEKGVNPRLRHLLATHYQTAYLSGTHAMLPSIRLVSTDPIR